MCITMSDCIWANILVKRIHNNYKIKVYTWNWCICISFRWCRVCCLPLLMCCCSVFYFENTALFASPPGQMTKIVMHSGIMPNPGVPSKHLGPHFENHCSWQCDKILWNIFGWGHTTAPKRNGGGKKKKQFEEQPENMSWDKMPLHFYL